MASFKKILSHPDKNAIVRMLIQGQGVRAVAKAIKEMQPDNKKLWVSVPTLQKFRKEKLNLEGKAIAEAKLLAKEKQEIREIKKEETQLKRIPAYKEKLQEAIDLHVDIPQQLRELLVLVKSRVEDLFDKSANGNLSINEEANLHKHFATWTSTIQQWAKYVDRIADKTVETNVNITVIEDQMSVIRETVREVMDEMEPAMAIKFCDRLSTKMSDLSYVPQKTTNFKTIHSNTKSMLEAHIEEAATEDGD
jgi:methyl-accepting chemotaxis protein